MQHGDKIYGTMYIHTIIYDANKRLYSSHILSTSSISANLHHEMPLALLAAWNTGYNHICTWIMPYAVWSR